MTPSATIRLTRVVVLTLGLAVGPARSESTPVCAKAACPGDPVALTRRTQAYEAIGQKAQALDDFRAALDASPKFESWQEGFNRIMTEQQRSECSI